jgi:hypothetical protein
MLDEGKAGNKPLVGGEPVDLAEAASVDLREGERNEFDELDGEQTSDVHPELFVNAGKTGTSRTHWAVGGSGAQGNEAVGQIALVAPQYDGAAPAAPRPATAWVSAGGAAIVRRSYTGVPVGPNGTYYITTSAAARIDRHEERHIASTRSIHDTHIVPLERRVAAYLTASHPFPRGATRADAIAALRTHVDWNGTITRFRNADSAANAPGGATDTADSATADFYHDYGARTVGGTGYAHYVDTPPGPPPPAPAHGPAPAPAHPHAH